MKLFKIKDVHIKDIGPGDTILIGGVPTTVCRENIKRCEFMGLTLFGDSYRLGTIPVKKVIHEKAR